MAEKINYGFSFADINARVEDLRRAYAEFCATEGCDNVTFSRYASGVLGKTFQHNRHISTRNRKRAEELVEAVMKECVKSTREVEMMEQFGVLFRRGG